MKIATTYLHYSGEQQHEQTRPQPDVSRVVDYPAMNFAAKQGDNLDAAEYHMSENRKILFKPFSDRIGDCVSAPFIVYEEMVARYLFGKSMHQTLFPHGVAGKFDADKLPALQRHWLIWVEAEHKTVQGVAETLGFDLAHGGAADIPDVLVP